MVAKRTTNYIKHYKDQNGTTINDSTKVKEHSIGFYFQLLNQSSMQEVHDINSLHHSEDDKRFINVDFTTDEIRRVVFQSPKNKSAGPHGFPAEFYKSAWHIIGNDVINTCLHFFRTGHLYKQFNNTFIAQIPKVVGDDNLENFRPISLCNFIYKVISKLVADRIQKVIYKIISPQKTAFR